MKIKRCIKSSNIFKSNLLLRLEYLIFALMLIPFVNLFGQESDMEKANKYYEKQEYKRAIQYYKKAVKNGENQTLCNFNCANAYFQLDSLPQSIVYYKESIGSAPDFFRGYLNLAIAYYSLDDLGECIAAIYRALDFEPENEKCRMILGSCYKQLNENAKAAVVFEQILEDYPEREDLYISLGEIYRDMGDQYEAAKWLLYYPAGGKKTGYVFQLLSDIYEKTGDKEKCLYYMQKSFEFTPENKWLYYRIVLTIQSLGNEFMAFEEAKRGLVLFNDFAELALLAGNSAFKQEMYGQAKVYYEKAESLGLAQALIGLENIKIIEMDQKQKMDNGS